VVWIVFSIDLGGFPFRTHEREPNSEESSHDPGFVSGIGNAYRIKFCMLLSFHQSLLTHKLTEKNWSGSSQSHAIRYRIWIDRLKGEAGRYLSRESHCFPKDMPCMVAMERSCPRCGQPIQRIRYADNETNYCAQCRPGGKILADRAFLGCWGKTWPPHLDELEALKAALKLKLSLANYGDA